MANGYRLEKWLAALLSLLFFLPFVARGEELAPLNLPAGPNHAVGSLRSERNHARTIDTRPARSASPADPAGVAAGALRRAHSALSRLVKAASKARTEKSTRTKLLLLFGVVLLLGVVTARAV
jgi:hypothetical protein